MRYNNTFMSEWGLAFRLGLVQNDIRESCALLPQGNKYSISDPDDSLIMLAFTDVNNN